MRQLMGIKCFYILWPFICIYLYLYCIDQGGNQLCRRYVRYVWEICKSFFSQHIGALPEVRADESFEPNAGDWRQWRLPPPLDISGDVAHARDRGAREGNRRSRLQSGRGTHRYHQQRSACLCVGRGKGQETRRDGMGCTEGDKIPL